jgi:putative DNA methylase
MSDLSASEARTLVGRASLPAYQTSDRLEPLFTTYERNLPHWRLTGANDFVTWRLHTSQPDLTPAERDLVLAAIRNFDGARYRLFAWVVMNDHAHVLLKPSEGVELEEILHTWKSFTARELQRHHGRTGRIWVEETFDRIVRDEREFWHKMQYVEENPRKRWPGIENYAWVGARCPE